MTDRTHDPYVGCLLGTAVGDALGLPCERLSPRRAARLFPDRGRHHFLPGRGMVSDDTDHACMVAQSLLEYPGDAARFQRRLAWRLRWWLAGFPAGVGLATLKSIVRLWCGVGPERSGVYSAGNGPAMRGPILGVALGHRPETLRAFAKASTRLTHTDPKALYGALAAALAAHHSARPAMPDGRAFLEELRALAPGDGAAEFLALVEKAAESADRGEPVAAFAEAIGASGGISGYMYHTMPCVLQVWWRFSDDFGGAMKEMIGAGGDTDTTAAILGGIVGARVGKAGIPCDMLSGILEWPRSVGWMERLGQALSARMAGDATVPCPGYFWPGVAPRNMVFLALVLAHGLRRLAPPY